MLKPDAVCVLFESNGLVLGVARRGTTDQFGLPGGSIEPNELPIDAARREMVEETGLCPVDLHEIYRDFDDTGNVVATYYSKNVTGELIHGDAGPAEYVTWETLLSGPFGFYNKKIMDLRNCFT